MKKLQEAWERWKSQHWDDKHRVEEGASYVWLQVDRPPLRRFWEDHKTRIKKAAIWLLALIGGALILKLLGLA